jgi:sugar/nucleoside kinase (ribokinase family)
MNKTDLLMLGHFAKDELIVDGKGEVSSGGGVYYGGIALRSLGLSVAVVTKLHADDFWRLQELREAGVQVYASQAPRTSGIANYYDSRDMERRICKPLGFAGKFNLDEIPDIPARIYAITPIIAGEVDLELVKLLARRAPLALDVQGFVRVRQDGDLVFQEWAEMEEGLSHITYLKVDRAEAELLTRLTNMEAAAKKLASYGPQEVIVTQSSGITTYADGKIYQAAFNPRSLEGRTGRGDTSFSVYLGMRLSSSPEQACRIAAAVTSMKQEKPGPWRGSLQDVKECSQREMSALERCYFDGIRIYYRNDYNAYPRNRPTTL